MNADSTELYQALVVEHANHPRNEGPLEGCTHEARGVNALCGDRITLRLRLVDGMLAEVRFEAKGCAIARASASILTEVVTGSTVEAARWAVARLEALVSGAAEPGPDDGALAPLAGARRFRSRRRCATLAWTTLADALAEG